MDLKNRLEKIKKILDTNKADDIKIFDLLDKEYIVDGVVIATALANKHLLALLDYLKKELKPDEEFLHVDSSDDWIVIDLGDILIHLMSEEARQKYHLEEFSKGFKRDENIPA